MHVESRNEYAVSYTHLVVEQMVFRNEKNGYTVLELAANGELYTVTGTMPDVRVGETITVTGAWSHHPTFGVQFKADAVTCERPETSEAILKYLSSVSYTHLDVYKRH